MEKKLQRIPHEGAIAGVCAGLGAYFTIDKTWVRLAFVISVFFSGYMGIGLLGPIVYIVLWIVLPVKAFSFSQDPFDVDYRTPESRQAADAYDAGNAAYGWNQTDRPGVPKNASKDRYVAGIILLALGLFFLLHQLDVFHWRDFSRFWPVLIIIAGLASIFGAFNSGRKDFWSYKQGDEPAQEPEPPTDDDGPAHTYTK
ncbi:PspC domain-containing protein [Parapedobacter sp. DT-150]|uniref:PspC domain-containing protein n=1 Tax=Parapedobacter sp. DT-150 TaxID=3396162 RepID=UPI003F1AF635